jgi:RNase P/RNase MRP subunit p30
MESTALTIRLGRFFLGSALCRHVHLLQFASTSANPSSLLRRFPCGMTLSSHCTAHYSIKSSFLVITVATVCSVSSRDAETAYLDHQ